MQMSTKHGFAFLCKPKCASTSIEAAIKEYCSVNFSGHPKLKHINARNFRRHILRFYGKGKNKIDIFCLMREPLEWLFSWYRYRQREDLAKKKRKDKQTRFTGKITFDEFVRQYISENKNASGLQSRFFLLENGNMGVNRVFPMSRMDLVAQYLTGKIGAPIEIPHLNVSPKMEMHLDPATLALAEEHFADDYRIYRAMEKAGVYTKEMHRELFSSKGGTGESRRGKKAKGEAGQKAKERRAT